MKLADQVMCFVAAAMMAGVCSILLTDLWGAAPEVICADCVMAAGLVAVLVAAV